MIPAREGWMLSIVVGEGNKAGVATRWYPILAWAVPDHYDEHYHPADLARATVVLTDEGPRTLLQVRTTIEDDYGESITSEDFAWMPNESHPGELGFTPEGRAWGDVGEIR